MQPFLAELRWFAGFLISLLLLSLPLRLAVTFLGGKVSFLRLVSVEILSALVPVLLAYFVTPYALLMFLFVTIAYYHFFNLPLKKAFLVWIVQYLILAALLYILHLAGISP